MGRKPSLPDPDAGGLEVRPGLWIPGSELQVRRTRSGGPGGQNVNKVNTRIELLFDVVQSTVLTDSQKQRILAHLAPRISKAGVLRVVAQAERTQSRNEARARSRMAELLAEALQERRTRRPTRPTRAAGERRVAAKKRRAAVKEKRRKVRSED